MDYGSDDIVSRDMRWGDSYALEISKPQLSPSACRRDFTPFTPTSPASSRYAQITANRGCTTMEGYLLACCNIAFARPISSHSDMSELAETLRSPEHNC